MESFVGIPYAEQPIGKKRFTRVELAPRVPVIDASKELDISQHQVGIISQPPDGFAQPPLPPQKEDGLTLNILRRSIRGNNLLVMVYIHSGGHTNGSAEYYPLTPFVRDGDVIAVNVNYRLAQLGFLPLKEFRDKDGASGNYGLYDTIVALEWIQKNIFYFDGDPNNVTIFGESAGAKTCEWLLSTPLCIDKQGNPTHFNKAIPQSGSYYTPPYSSVTSVMTPEQWENYTPVGSELNNRKTILKRLNALNDDNTEKYQGQALVEYLQSLPVEDFTFGSFHPGPVLDGYGWTIDPLYVATSSTEHIPDRPVLFGANSNKVGLWQGFGIASQTADNWLANIKKGIEDGIQGYVGAMTIKDLDFLIKSYQLYNQDGTENGPNNVLLASHLWAYKVLRFAVEKADGKYPTFFYSLADYLKGEGANLDLSTIFKGAHALELVYLFELWNRKPYDNGFGNFFAGDFGNLGYTPTEKEVLLGQQLRNVWITFATDTKPKLLDGTLVPTLTETGQAVVFG